MHFFSQKALIVYDYIDPIALHLFVMLTISECFSAIQIHQYLMLLRLHLRRSPYFNLIERDPVNGKIKLSKTSSTSILRRQDSPECFDMNASIYAWKRECLNYTFILDLRFYIVPEERSFDIDNNLTNC